MQLIERMLHHDPPSPRQFDRRIPRDLETVILKAIAKEPGRRYQTAEEMAADLQRFLSDRPVQARRSTAIEQFGRWCRRNPWLAGANIAAAVLTTVVAIGSTLAAWVFHNQRDQIGRHLHDIQSAETRGRERLLESLTAQASAKRHSRQLGQRFGSLDALAQAAVIARDLKMPAKRIDPLRDEAIASLALPDLRPAGRVIHRPSGAFDVAFDPTMTRYATLVPRRDNPGPARRRRPGTRTIPRGDREFFGFGFSPDGRYLATRDSQGHALTVWDIDQRMACLNDRAP